MARKNTDRKDEEKEYSGKGFIWSTVVESLKVMVIEGIKSSMYDVLDFLKENIETMQKRMIHTFSFYFLLGLSTIFLSIAFIYLIEEYLGLSAGWSYLIIGGVILVWALIVKNKLKEV